MANQEHQDLIGRFKGLVSERTTVQQMWDAIETYITPYRGKFFRDQRNEHTIDWFESRDIYDSTAPMAAKNLAASIHGSLTSPTIKWFDIRFRDDKLNDAKAPKEWLQGVADAIFYELQDSNFDLEINKAYQDLVGFGTALLTLEEGDGPASDWNGLDFTSVPLKEAFFEEDYRSGGARFYRKVQWTPTQLLSKFGENGVPEHVKDLAKGSKKEAPLDVLFAIYPRNNKVMPLGATTSPSKRPYSYCYLLLSDGEEIEYDPLLGKEMGYYEMPAFAARWDMTNSSKWGNSPAMLALGDVLTLNAVVKDTLRARAKMIDPPLMASERSVYTSLNLDPATVTTVRDPASAVAAMPGPDGLSLATSNDEINRLQSAIRNYFMVDRIDFPDMQPQPMTATEAQIRYERMQRYLGATLAHMRNDLLNPIIARSFRMMLRKGVITEPPAAVLESDPALDVEYLGSLSRAQQVDEAAVIERVAMSAGNLATVYGQDALDPVDPAEAVRQIAVKLNAPAAMMRSKQDVKDRQGDRQEQEAQMMESQQMQARGEGEQAMQEAAGGS